MVVAAGSRESAPLEPIHCAPKASPPAGSPDRPSLHLRERNSSMKNRKRESCTSGTVRDEDGNILIYSARPRCARHHLHGAGIRKPSQRRSHLLLVPTNGRHQVAVKVTNNRLNKAFSTRGRILISLKDRSPWILGDD